MQALVKMPRIDIRMHGDIPIRVIEALKNEFEGNLKIYEGDDEYVDIIETDWYKEIKSQTTPGDAMRIYRENSGMTQAELGKKLGNIPRQLISNMECGKRAISLATAKKLAAIFDVPAIRFLDL